MAHHDRIRSFELLRHRTIRSDKPQDSSFCAASEGYAFGEPSLQGGIRRCASTVGIRSTRARPAPRPWHAPKKLCFGGKPRAKRSARRGRKAPRSCAPNAMPPFRASLENASLPPPADAFFHPHILPSARRSHSARASPLHPSIHSLSLFGRMCEPGAEAACLFEGTPGVSHA